MQALFVECIQCLIDAASLAGVQSDKFPSSGVGEGGVPRRCFFRFSVALFFNMVLFITT